MTKCEVCGSPVKVIGTSTRYYEPLYDELKKKTDKLVSALTSIRVEATKGDGTTTECEMAALADEALAAYHEEGEEK